MHFLLRHYFWILILLAPIVWSLGFLFLWALVFVGSRRERSEVDTDPEI